jgi:hypothetical protein
MEGMKIIEGTMQVFCECNDEWGFENVNGNHTIGKPDGVRCYKCDFYMWYYPVR